jgi:rubrerythrin
MAKKNGNGSHGGEREADPAPEIEVRISPGELLSTLARLDLEAGLAYDEAAEMVPDERLRADLEGFAEEHRRHFDVLNALLETEGEARVAPTATGAPLLAGIMQLAGPLGVDVVVVALLGNEQLTNLSYDAALAYQWDDETQALLQKFAADEQRHLAWLAGRHDELAGHPGPEHPGAAS